MGVKGKASHVSKAETVVKKKANLNLARETTNPEEETRPVDEPFSIRKTNDATPNPGAERAATMARSDSPERRRRRVASVWRPSATLVYFPHFEASRRTYEHVLKSTALYSVAFGVARVPEKGSAQWSRSSEAFR